MTSLPTTRLTPHPYLSVADGARLSWDIRASPTARSAVIAQGGHYLSAFSSIAHLPATTPPSFTLYISLHNMPQWSFVVQSPQPITCQQLLDAIHAQLRVPVSETELKAYWTPQQQVAIHEAYRANRAQFGAEMPREVCRADVLGSQCRWAGLYFNEKQARLQYNIPTQAMNDSTVRTLVLTLSLA
ncbi:hypothetical protein AURDEDRAFT_123165 [Auricularia subglabra TFB-10046 SS5]|nr:hypothetical protein AURDEDRAFT_123165 [Auricularia subglabra TFB-10046 SS5]